MSKRIPTPEEKRIWRESNRFTQKKSPESELEIEIEIAPPPPVQSARAGFNPPPAKPAPRAELQPLSSREAKKRLGAQPPVQAVLDLHGYSRPDAHGVLGAFIAQQAGAGRRHLLIITGKGRASEGVLRRELPHWLNDARLRPLIAAFFYAAERDGGDGAMHVLLKKSATQP